MITDCKYRNRSKHAQIFYFLEVQHVELTSAFAIKPASLYYINYFVEKTRVNTFTSVFTNPGKCQTNYMTPLIRIFSNVIKIVIKPCFPGAVFICFGPHMQITEGLPTGYLFQCSPEINRHFPFFPKIKILIFFAPCSPNFPLFSCPFHFF